MTRQRCEFDAGLLLPNGRTRWTCTRPDCGRVIEHAGDKAPYAGCPMPRARSRYKLRPTPTEGPGTELLAIVKERGLRKRGCGCAAIAARMNRWGIEGSRQHTSEIVAHLLNRHDKLTAAEWLELIEEAIERSGAPKSNAKE